MSKYLQSWPVCSAELQESKLNQADAKKSPGPHCGGWVQTGKISLSDYQSHDLKHNYCLWKVKNWKLKGKLFFFFNIESYSLLIFFFLTTPQGLQDLSSLTRNWTVATTMLVAESCLTVWDPMNCTPPGSSVYEIFQVRILEGVAIPFSRGSSRSKDRTWVSRIAGRFFTIWATREVPPAFFFHMESCS